MTDDNATRLWPRRTRLRLQVLGELRNPSCRACPLGKTTGTVCVMGRGDLRARIHVVGEAPGAREAETGMPFMGPAGKLMDEIIRGVGIKVYISNIARCRPPNNRTPTREERLCCGKLYLRPELRIIDPDVIVTVGTTSSEYFLGKRYKRGRVHSTRIAGRRRMIIPTYHPAYFLHSGDRGGLRAIRRAFELAKEMTTKEPNATT